MQSSKSRCCAVYGIKWGVKGIYSSRAIIPARSWVCIKRATVNTTRWKKPHTHGAPFFCVESCKAGEDGILLSLLLLLRRGGGGGRGRQGVEMEGEGTAAKSRMAWMAMSGGITVSGSCKTKLWKGSRQFLSADSVFTGKMRGVSFARN